MTIQAKKFSETQPVNEQEKDRFQLKVGDRFTLTGFVVQGSEKYKDGIAKINGRDGKTGMTVKFWTTAAAIHHQLQNMAESVGIEAGQLQTPVGVEVFEKKSKAGKMYLTFGDPT